MNNSPVTSRMPASQWEGSAGCTPACGEMRYNQKALSYTCKGNNIVELLGLTASQAMDVFEDAKIRKHLKVMQQVGLYYLTLGQPPSTLS